MNESQFSREIRKSLSQYGYFLKMVGGAFTVPGIPDILGCYQGKFIGIECKLVKTKPKHPESLLWNSLFSLAQIDNLQAIKDSGGIALGLIHIADNPREHYAIVLAPIQIKHLNRIDLGSYNNLLKTNRLFIIKRNKGLWDVEKLLSNFIFL